MWTGGTIETIPDKTRGVVYSITCLDFLIVLFDRKLICVTPPCDLSQVTYATSEKHSANTKDDPANTSLRGESMWPMSQGKLPREEHTQGISA